MKPTQTFLDRLTEEAAIVYDGGFGAELFQRGVQLTNSSLANETNPDEVVAVHKDYINAGSEVIGTNTFVASSLHMEMAGKNAAEAEEVTRLACEHAAAAVADFEQPVFIAGSVGPSPGAIEADAGDVDFGIPNSEVREAHRSMIGTLAEGGVDFLAIETQFSAKEAAIAVDEGRRTGLPIAVNMTYKYTVNRRTDEIIYRTDWGHSAGDLIDFLASGEFSDGDDLLPHVHLLGLNCGAESRNVQHTGMPYAIEGTQQLRNALRERGVVKKMMAYPNAGMPLLDRNQLTYYSQGPEDMAPKVAELLAAGASVIGGCCGTTPAHIAAFAQSLKTEE